MMQGTATLWVHRQYIFSRPNCSMGAANAIPDPPLMLISYTRPLIGSQPAHRATY